jgi:replicative DNA helicase
MSDLRGSGQLLHDADTIVFITKKPPTASTINEKYRIRQLEFSKQRDGDLGDNYTIQLGLTRGYPKFINLETKTIDLSNVLPGGNNKTKERRIQGAMDIYHE